MDIYNIIIKYCCCFKSKYDSMNISNSINTDNNNVEATYIPVIPINNNNWNETDDETDDEYDKLEKDFF